MRVLTQSPASCPVCSGWRRTAERACLRSVQPVLRHPTARRALDEREVQAETASSSEELQHTVKAGFDAAKFTPSSVSKALPSLPAIPPAPEREAFWGRLAVLLLGVRACRCVARASVRSRLLARQAVQTRVLGMLRCQCGQRHHL
jgi:hypothetical protein